MYIVLLTVSSLVFLCYVPNFIQLRAAVSSIKAPFGCSLLWNRNNTPLPWFMCHRLVNAHHHLLALRICKELDMDQGTVLHHWAKARISADESTTSNEELKNILAGKLKACPFVHYATIAEHAQAQGRRELAAQLLDDETCAAKQVPLLLELEEEQRALEKAVESGDTHLVYLALFRIYHRTVAAAKGMPEFIKAISSKPAAYALFMKYCKAQSPNLAEQIYNLDGNTEGLAEIKFNEALSTSLKIPTDTAGEETVSLSNLRDRVVSQLRDCAAQYAKSRKHEFQSKSAEEFANLRKEQAKLQLSTGRNMFLSLSVIDTIRQCIRLGYNKGAADIRRQFGISDKHFYWVKVRTLAERGQWEGLEVFAQERRPPIGWEPFIQACVDHNAPRERTGKFIDRLPDSEAKVEWYTKVGLNLQAARTAESLQSIDLMTRVQGIVGPNSQLGMKTAQMIERVKGLQPR
ncbi:unnamed protein product [Ostreobium quekettii]|uniref:Vps16 C-terminal domain-containing protein n=1 Tax=Ostreobium quekettii TaxID=121088 RepID=A0A8S1ILW4_9CHLO|nr:unnamed protein product [Ostreobium quekettii]|eukprot:evm.model.scf_11.22 EVM.evm.TU.scf_11.22   scf_11:209541-214125(-)